MSERTRTLGIIGLRVRGRRLATSEGSPVIREEQTSGGAMRAASLDASLLDTELTGLLSSPLHAALKFFHVLFLPSSLPAFGVRR
jgi:hypothetical protein